MTIQVVGMMLMIGHDGHEFDALRTFCGTARGSYHILRGIPCEDASASFSDEKQGYYIAAVSDGHGDSKCFRSKDGSRFAIDVIIEVLKEFARYVIHDGITPLDLANDSFIIRHLTDTIVAKWYDTVIMDFRKSPMTTEEKTIIGEKKIDQISDDEILHFYGATLIAALWLPNMLVLLQQGDGRCDVFYSDGVIDQPIPWDSRCVNNSTTSLCDYDASVRFRSRVIDTQSNRVIGCFLASDGVEDSYRDSVTTMEGVHTFFKNVSNNMLEMDDEAFSLYLRDFLPEFSRNGLWGKSGSGDDVSIAGIVNVSLLTPFRGAFLKDIQKYKLSEELFWKKDELKGKTRKYEILKRRMEEAKTKYDESKSKEELITRRLSALHFKQKELIGLLKEESILTAQMLQSSQKATAALETVFNEENEGNAATAMGQLDSIAEYIKEIISFSSDRKNSLGTIRQSQAQMCRELQMCTEQCAIAEEEYLMACDDTEKWKKQRDKSEQEYVEYESRYKSIEKSISMIQNELDILMESSEHLAEECQDMSSDVGVVREYAGSIQMAEVPIEDLEKNVISNISDRNTDAGKDAYPEHDSIINREGTGEVPDDV